jgi:hypothetical protein
MVLLLLCGTLPNSTPVQPDAKPCCALVFLLRNQVCFAQVI